MTLPGWFPVLGQNFTEVDAELSTAQAVTPGQGQTVNVAGVEVGEISRVRLEDGKAIVTLKLEEDSVPVYTQRERAAAAQDRPEGHGRRADAGHEGRRRARGRPADPDRPDAARRQPRRDPRRARRRHAQLPAAAALRRRAGPEGQRARAGEHDPPLRADSRATRARSPSSSPTRRANIKRAIHNFSLVVDELGGKDDQLAEFVENSNAVFASLASQDANLRATLQELPSTLAATRTALGKAEVLADELGPTLQALRPGARALGPTLRQTRPFLRETTPMIKDEIRPFVRASRPLVSELRPGDARPLGAHARPAAQLQGPQRAAQHARLQPARRHRGGLPLLGLVGQPPRAGGLLQPGRRTGRSAAASSWSAARACRCSRTSCSATRSSACSRSCSRRPTAPTCARRRAQQPGAAGASADAEGRPQLRPDRRDGRLRAVVLRAGAVPVARVRRPDPAQAEGLPRQRLVRRGLAARDGGRRADLRRARRQGQGDRARRQDRPLAGHDGARGQVQPAAVGLEGAAAPEDAAGRDLRRADAGHRAGEEGARGRPAAARAACPRRSSSTRSCARSTPRRAPRSRSGCRRRRRRSAATGATSTTRSATSARSPRTPPSWSTSSTARSPPSRA